jgi:hypothetical protein
MNGYNLTRNWFNYKFENPEKVKAIHTDFYFYLVDQWNRLGQKPSFGLPTLVTMECLGIGSYNTYKKTLNDLIDFGFVILIKESKNQHQSKIVALSKIDKATDKALDKATIKASDEASDKATDSIIKQINKETINKETNIPTFEDFKIYALEKEPTVSLSALKNKYDAWEANDWKNGNDKPIKNWRSALLQTMPYIEKIKKVAPDGYYYDKQGILKRKIS